MVVLGEAYEVIIVSLLSCSLAMPVLTGAINHLVLLCSAWPVLLGSRSEMSKMRPRESQLIGR